MPSLANHQSNKYTKCLLVGDSKAGKTGSLTSLVKAGYKLRVLDYDNGLDVLKQFVNRECPDKLENVEFRTLRDKRKATGSGSIVDKPRAFVDGIRMMDHWKYDDTDLGSPYNWGPDCILVLDSLSRFSDAAYDWRAPLAGKDARMAYKDAQDAVSEALATLTGDNFETNVIVLAHIRYLEQPDGSKKGFPQSVGSAICSEIPQWFNSYAMYENKGGKRTLRTTSTPMIDLANPAPFAMAPSFPVETGLADFFAVLREPPKGSVNGPKHVSIPQADRTADTPNGSSQRSIGGLRQPVGVAPARRA